VDYLENEFVITTSRQPGLVEEEETAAIGAGEI
jgi:hypothetical protein